MSVCFWFGFKKKTPIWNEFGSAVQFEKAYLGSDIIVTLQFIYRKYHSTTTDMLNELCISQQRQQVSNVIAF